MSEKSPWLTIWCEPRATIQRIVAENPNRSLWVLAAIYGFLSILNSFQSIAVVSVERPFLLLLVAAVLSPFWGYAVFSIWSWVVHIVGKWLKGEGSFINLRAAFAWSCAPLSVNVVFWVLMIAFFGATFFLNGQEGYPATHRQAAFVFLMLIGKVVVAIWSLVIYINALAEVQKFSILRSIFNVIISWIIVGVVLGLILFSILHLLQMSGVVIQ